MFSNNIPLTKFTPKFWPQVPGFAANNFTDVTIALYKRTVTQSSSLGPVSKGWGGIMENHNLTKWCLFIAPATPKSGSGPQCRYSKRTLHSTTENYSSTPGLPAHKFVGPTNVYVWPCSRYSITWYLCIARTSSRITLLPTGTIKVHMRS